MADPPKPAAGAAPQGAAGEPSMEEILASIRRILSEDESGAQAGSQGAEAAAGAAPPAAAAGQDDGVLQLTEDMLAGQAPSAGEPAAVETQAATAAEPPPATMAVQPPVFAPPPAYAAAGPAMSAPPPGPARDEALLEAGTAAAAAAAFGSLSRGQQPDRLAPAAVWPLGQAGLTVEEIVRQELRPLLSAWLNANLPRIVEEAVAREMERVRARIG
ncbi:MAG: DUF2497 domain-containing protein [Acetobacteraceae bacterium]|nr:DUF2497 domain-containing protein [Acetobacteraceae bacterium]